MPTLPDDFAPHPARDASLASMHAVEAGDKAAWLALFAEDAVIQDPIGVSPLDPTGEGHRGPAAREAFYDMIIGPNTITFDIERSHAGGQHEVVNVGTISSTMADGSVVHTDLAITYYIDDDGKVTALRAYWEMDKLRFG